jgi:DNA-directed RNA polymerase subunit alpha
MTQDTTNAMNPTFTVSEVAATATQATIVCEPLEQGYGHTLGNALRRVLLSSLPGFAVSKVQVDGVDHQFTTLEGLSEDVVDLILNIKQIRVKSSSQQAGIMRLDVTGPADVTAGDIEAEAGFEVVNQDLPLATLAKGKRLKVEMTVEPGVGYVLSRGRQTNVIGEIPVDAQFSPIIKVSYKVESTRVGRRTDYDKLLLDVQTDGTMAPLAAVQYAAQILSRQFQQIINPVVHVADEVTETISPAEAEVMKLTVEELDLPTRIANALRKGGFKTVGDLVGAPRDVIAKVKNLGEKSVDVINDALAKKGVSLGE